MSDTQGFMTDRGYVPATDIYNARVSDNYLILETKGYQDTSYVRYSSCYDATLACLKLGFNPEGQNMSNINSQQLQQMLGLQQTRLARMHYPGDLPSNLNENKKEKSKMGEMLNDVKNYVKEHRSVIYTVVLIVLADHFLLGGKLRHKLEALLNGALDKAQEKLNGTKAE